MKKILVLFWLVAILSGISFMLWHEDWKYSLPTPVPEKYNPSKSIDGAYLAAKTGFGDQRPFFLHFFNPTCPCSKFNIPHFRSLVNKYSDRVNFAIVVMTADARYTEKTIRDKFELDIPVFFDTAIADSCGVYSTPQAVIIDAGQKLYYRGNYNKSRFCVDKNTNFAQMAIDSLLSERAVLITDKAALKSYGCELPKCCKETACKEKSEK